MKLPGWLFMLLGALIVGYSKFVEYKNGNNLTFFFWAGLIFLGYGLVKEMLHRLQKPKKKHKPTPPHKQQGKPVMQHQGQQTHSHTKPHPHTSHPHEPKHKRCPSCHNVNMFRARFCHGCGYRMV